MSGALKFVNIIIGALLNAGRAFFDALIAVVWGMVSFFALGVLLNYYKQDPTVIANLLPIISFVQHNWGLFFAVIFVLDFIGGFVEFMNKVRTKDDDEDDEDDEPVKKKGKSKETKL